MPKYRIYGIVTGSKYLGQVTAKSKREAIAKAEEELECYVSLCHHCSGEIDDPEITKIVADKV